MWVYAEGEHQPGEAHCRSCQAPVTWVQNVATGKRMPLDGHDLAWDGADEVPDRHGQVVPAVSVDIRPSKAAKHKTHFATCGQAEKWRRT